MAGHFLKTLKKHLEELLEENLIEGPWKSEHCTGWVSNVVVVIARKAWDKEKIRTKLDTKADGRQCKTDSFSQTDLEQLRHKF